MVHLPKRLVYATHTIRVDLDSFSNRSKLRNTNNKQNGMSMRACVRAYERLLALTDGVEAGFQCFMKFAFCRKDKINSLVGLLGVGSSFLPDTAVLATTAPPPSPRPPAATLAYVDMLDWIVRSWKLSLSLSLFSLLFLLLLPQFSTRMDESNKLPVVIFVRPKTISDVDGTFPEERSERYIRVSMSPVYGFPRE
jgi:hypothetical protein